MKIEKLLGFKNVTKPTQHHFYETSHYIELEQKIQEMISILENTGLTKDEIKTYEGRISEAFQKSLKVSDPVKPFKLLNEENNLSREELLEGLETLLIQTKIDSRVSRRYLRRNAFQKLLLCIIAVLLIATGFAMIIMPAPPSFEIFTVFYFNTNDGVTVMDLVSLLIILSGVFLFVLNFNKK